MLDPDISTAGALRHLSQPDTDEWAVDRRRFLQLVGMGVGAGVVAGSGSSLLESLLTGNEPWAQGAAPVGATDGILVILGMFGGNDGLNMVVPTNDSAYQAQRANIAIAPARHVAARLGQRSQQGADRVQAVLGRRPPRGRAGRRLPEPRPQPLQLDGHLDVGHHRAGSRRRVGWAAGSTAISARRKNLFAAAEIGHSLPLHLVGRVQRGTTVPAGRPAFGADTSAQSQRLYSSLRTISAPNGTTWKGRVGQAIVDQLDVATHAAPDHPRRAAGRPNRRRGSK